MIINERDIRKELVGDAARKMATAARTAPKGRGHDIQEIAIVEGDDILKMSAEMMTMFQENGMSFLERDAENIKSADAILIVGTRTMVQGLNCGHCGFPTCEGKPHAVPCAINVMDIGIALGSACATAADQRVDTRVMYSAGMAAQRLGMLGDCRCVMAIPISIGSKNPFFDRKPKEQQPGQQ